MATTKAFELGDLGTELVVNADGTISSLNIDSDAVTEGSTNQYFTDARARAAISVTGNLTYNSSTGVLGFTLPTTVASISNHDTDDLTEGSSNLYFTSARARASLTAGTGITYSSSTGNISLTASGVTAGSYGGSTAIPIITVDTYGRITSASTAAVAGVDGVSYNTSTGAFTVETATGTDYSANITLAPFDTGDLAEGSRLYYTDARAQAAITKAVVDALNVDADTLDGLDSTQFLRSDTNDSIAARLSVDYGANATAINLSEAHTIYAFGIQNRSSGSRLNFSGNSSYTSIQASSSTTSAEDIALNPFGGNVGIGTTSPDALLHVYKNSGEAGLYVGSGDAGGALLVLDGDANGDGAGGNYAYIRHTTAGNLEFNNIAPNGTEFVFNEGGYDKDFRVESDTNDHALFVQGSDGHVGIGTSSPLYTLVVSEDGNDNIEIGGGVIQRYNRSTSAYGAMNYYSASHNFYTTGGGQQSLFIKSDGNVGIGTNNPGEKLQVNSGNILIYSGTGESRGELKIRHNASAGNNPGSGRITTQHSNQNTYSGDLILSSYYYNGSVYDWRDTLTVSAYGRIGVNTTSPSQELHVVGRSLITGASYFGNTTFARWAEGSGTGGININPGDGAGTHIAIASNHSDGYANLYLNRIDVTSDITSNNNRFIDFYYDGVSAVRMRGNSSYNFSIDMVGGGNFLLPNGNVGIGTTGPNESLHIYRASGDASFRLQSSSQQMRIDQNSIRTTTNSSIGIFTNGNTNQLYLNQSTGNVGIGTSSPSASLQVGDATGSYEFITVNALPSYYSGIKLARGAGDWSSLGNNNYGMLVTDAGFEISKFTSKGNNDTGRTAYLQLDDAEVNVNQPFGLLSATSDPTGTRAGQLYYNSNNQKVKFYDGSTWQDISSNSIVRSNLLLHWDMTDSNSYAGSGSTVYDVSGNGYNGTIQGNPTYSSSNNGYMVFDGFGDYITSSLTQPSGARAFGMWVYYSSLTQPNSEGYQLQGIQAGGGYTYQGIVDGGNVYYYIGSGTGGTISYTLSSGQWYYQVISFDGNQYTVYVNGALIQSGSASTGTTSNTFSAGAINGNYRLYGYGSEWQFYGQNLTAAEVQQNFNAGRGRYGI